jgi:hypothetical protein
MTIYGPLPFTSYDDLLSAKARRDRQAKVDQLIKSMGHRYACYSPRPLPPADPDALVRAFALRRDPVAHAVSQHPGEDGERYAYG